MDIVTALVDMLRNGKENAVLNQGGPLAAPAPQKGMSTELVSAAKQLSNPEYAAYVREAKASGEQVMDENEFARFQAGN